MGVARTSECNQIAVYCRGSLCFTSKCRQLYFTCLVNLYLNVPLFEGLMIYGKDFKNFNFVQCVSTKYIFAHIRLWFITFVCDIFLVTGMWRILTKARVGALIRNMSSVPVQVLFMCILVCMTMGHRTHNNTETH